MKKSLASLMVKCLLLVVSCVLFVIPAVADIPQYINIQGRLMDDSGKPVTTGSITFSMKGNLITTLGQTITPDTNGIFNAVLDFSKPYQGIDMTEGQTVMILLNGNDYKEIDLQSVPYAFTAKNLKGGTVNATGDAAIRGTSKINPDTYGEIGKRVGIGSSFGVYGQYDSNTSGSLGQKFLISKSNPSYSGVYGRSSEDNGIGVLGYSNKYVGVHGEGGAAGGSFESTGLGISSLAPKNYFSGNVGIGTDAPLAGLDVLNADRPYYDPNDNTNNRWGVRGQSSPGVGAVLGYSITDQNNQTTNYGLYSFGSSNYFSGNVGIGTTADPKNKLEINGTTLIGSASKGISMYTYGDGVDIASVGKYLAINYQSGQNTLLNVMSGNVGIGTTDPGTAKFSVMGGKVGIGTTTPGASLEVKGDIKIGAYPGNLLIGGNDETYSVIKAEKGILTINKGAWSSVSIPSGNVGIGKYSPSEKLEVAGNIFSSGNIMVGNQNSPFKVKTLSGVSDANDNFSAQWEAGKTVWSIQGVADVVKNTNVITTAFSYIKSTGMVSASQIGPNKPVRVVIVYTDQ